MSGSNSVGDDDAADADDAADDDDGGGGDAHGQTLLHRMNAVVTRWVDVQIS